MNSPSRSYGRRGWCGGSECRSYGKKEGLVRGVPEVTDAKKRSEVTDLEPPGQKCYYTIVDSEVTAEVTGLGTWTAQAEVTEESDNPCLVPY